MLYTMVIKVRHEQITVIRYGNTARRIKLAGALARAADDLQRFTSQSEHLNPAIHVLRHIEFVVVNGQVHGEPELTDPIAGCTEFTLEVPLVIENLDTPVAGIGHEHFGVCYRNPGGVVELPRATAFFAPGKRQRVGRFLVPVDGSAHAAKQGESCHQPERSVGQPLSNLFHDVLNP